MLSHALSVLEVESLYGPDPLLGESRGGQRLPHEGMLNRWERCFEVEQHQNRLWFLHREHFGKVIHLEDVEIHRPAVEEALLGCGYPPLKVATQVEFNRSRYEAVVRV